MKNKKIFVSLNIIFVVLVCFYMIKNPSSFSITQKTFATLEKGSIGEGPRKKYNFNNDWKFAKGVGVINSGSDLSTNPLQTVTVIPTTENPYSTSYTTDNRWENVSLPHTYNDIDTFDNFMESGTNGERSMYSGTAWYRKTFFVPESYRGKRIVIEFEAARQAAEIYVNGTKLEGTYENGFIAFGYDITSYLNYNADNLITVMVDNTYPYKIKGTNSVVSWHDSHWHPNYGGLYRDSYLYVYDDLHLTLPLYSFTKGEGTYVYTSNETSSSATVNVDAQVENSSNATQEFYYRAIVKDKNGVVKLTLNSNVLSLASGEKSIFSLNGTLINPIRWSTKYPYLYTVDCELYKIVDGQEVLIDNNTNPLGVRTFRITSDSGFYLNENRIEINGWGQKTTNEWAGLGAAYPDWMQDKVLRLMKDANGNYIRWGHVAGSETQVSIADKYGILVTQPGVDGEGETVGGVYDSNSYKLRVEAFRDMIIKFRNNPSIIMWEIGNQSEGMLTTFSSSSLESIEGLGLTGSNTTVAGALKELVSKYDHGNYGNNPNSGTYDNTNTSSNRLITVRRANANISSYIDVAETTEGGGGLSGKPLIEGEYNRLEARRAVWDYSTPGFTNFQNNTSDVAYKNITSEEFSTSQVEKKKQILNSTGGVGGANWIFSDSISHGRVRSEVARVSGEVDATMLEKESYYVDKVIYGNTPDAYIIGHWNYPVDTIKDVYVAAKGVVSLDLYVNDTKYTSTVSSDYLYKFSNVVYESGTIRVEGKNQSGTVIVNSSKTTHGAPAALKLTPIVGPSGLLANGSDVLLVDVEVVDSKGRRCTTYDGTLSNDKTNFTMTDPNNAGIFKGGYNSGLESSINKNYLYIEGGISRVAIKTTMNAGQITLSASTDNGLRALNDVVVNTTAIDNTNGVASLSMTPTYDLSSLADPGYGTGEQSISNGEEHNNSSTLIEQFNYTGSSNSNNSINDALSSGKKMYSDSNITFTKIPYRYLNSEYLRLPSIDNGSIALDLVTFIAKRNIDVFILRDDNVINPSWLNEYTLTNDRVIGGNGVNYKVYKKSFLKGSIVTIGGNSDNGLDGLDGVNNIVAFKETDKYTNAVFFKEDFNDFNSDSIINGWNATIPANHNVEIDSTFSGNTLHFAEDDTDVSCVQKEFSPVTGQFEFSFRAYITDTKTNTWLRFWFSKDKLISEDDKADLVIESFINKSGSTSNVLGRTTNSEGAATTAPMISNISINSWHNYKYYIDTVRKVYKVSVDDGNYSNEFEFSLNDTEISNLLVGASKSGTTDFYVDDLEISPIISDSPVDAIVVDGVNISDFDSSNYNYYISGVDSSSVITINANEYYKSHVTTYNEITKMFTVSACNVSNVCTDYYISDGSNSNLMDGMNKIVSSNITIQPDIIDDVPAIHFHDENAGELGHIEKVFDSVTNRFEVTYDAYITDLKSNDFLRVYFQNGNAVSDSEYTNIAVLTYMSTKYVSSYGGTGFGIDARAHSNNSMTYNRKFFPLNTWHTIKYLIDIDSHTYSTYVDNTLVHSNKEFMDNVNNIDTLVIGTGKSGESDFYIKNININPIYGNPVEGIKVDNRGISGFVNSTYEYQYHSDSLLSNDTNIEIVSNSSFDSFTVNKDTILQKATITVLNKAGTEYTYVLNFFADGASYTKTDIRNLIDNFTSQLDSSDYTNISWNAFSASINAGEAIILNPDATDDSITNAYINICNSFDRLLLVIDVSYSSSLINTIHSSINYQDSISFNKVLDNNELVYLEGNDTFRSVPYKYLNSEYITLKNLVDKKNGSIDFIATRDLYLLIFKDRASGPLLNNEFTFTNDIVTSTSGIVYNVYKKLYTAGSTVEISQLSHIENQITNNNNIIAIREKIKLDNNVFFNESMNDYTNTNDFYSSWNTVVPSGNTIDLRYLGTETDKSLYLKSDVNVSMPFVFKGFARQYDKFKLKYKVYVTTKYDNRYIRIWLQNNSTLPSVDDWKSNSDIKDNTLIESYIDANTSAGMSGYGVVNRTSSGIVPIGRVTKENWTSIEYIVDVPSKKYDVNITNGDNTISKTNFGFLNESFDYSDYVIFGGRKAGYSETYFKDIEIIPIERSLATSVSINSNNIADYTSFTKDYLYKSDDLSTKTLSVNTDNTFIQESSNNDYNEFNITDNTNYTANHRIYFELNTAKSDLEENINVALNLDSEVYTTTSWNNLLTVLNTAKTILQNSEATQSEIDTANTLLETRIGELVRFSNVSLVYTNKTNDGKEAFGDTLKEINLTNNSSFNFTTKIDQTIIGYKYKDCIGTRILNSNVTFPVNTKLTFIDTSSATPKYYYYIVSQNDVTTNKRNYLLSDFKLMGTTNVSYTNLDYYNSSTNKIYELFKFIIDFESTLNPLQTGTYNVKLVTVYGSDEVNTPEVQYSIYSVSGTTTFDASLGSETYKLFENIKTGFSFSYAAHVENEKTIDDTKKLNKKIGLNVYLYKNSEKINFPITTSVAFGDDICYAVGNICKLKLADNMDSINDNLMIDFGKLNTLQAGDYKFRLELISSEDGLNKGDILATKDLNFSISSIYNSSLKVEARNTNPNILKRGNYYNLIYDFTYLNDRKVKIITSLEKRVDNSYSITDLQDYVLNSLVKYDTNKYLLNRINTLNLRFTRNIPVGTYRIKFQYFNDNQEINSYYQYFIVK